MGRRSDEHRGVGYDVFVRHPARPESRRCRLTLTRRGVVLRAAGAGRDTPIVLAVPWWAVEGLSADSAASGPDGRELQVLEIHTDAGVLELLCTATDVGALLGRLSSFAARWRVARRSPVRLTASYAASAAPAVRRAGRTLTLAGAAGRRWARRRWTGVEGRLPRPLRPVGRIVGRRPMSALTVLAALCMCAAVLVAGALSGQPLVASGGVLAQVSGPGLDESGMAQILAAAQFQAGIAAHLAPATAPPPPVPAAVTAEPPLSPHEVFGFAPYWALPDQQTFDVSGFTTLAYFAVGVNANGTLDESGTGWDGYESQDFVNLVARAHAAGDRVVLTVNCFSQHTLNVLTSSPAAARTLASQVVGAIAAKNLDGVNIDFEGQGSEDQRGLTSLVATVAQFVHAANPHYQVTMDTYASSAGDPNGFYDVRALSQVVDGFFVMAYDLNLSSPPTTASPITSGEFSDGDAAAQYATAVPPSKVILGTAYFGYDWPTTNGTMAAHAMGTGVPVTEAEVVASGDPIYWDSVTDTAWTSYEVGNQWYEEYFEDQASVYLVAQLAQSEGLAGVGVWALGMDSDDTAMTSALDGNVPPVRAGPAGPASTSSSEGTFLPASATPVTVVTGQPATTTPTTAPSYFYTGTWDGQSFPLTLVPATAEPSGTPAFQGTLKSFSTNNPSFSCLVDTPSPLYFWRYPGSSVSFVLAQTPSNCTNAEFSFTLGDGSTSNTTMSRGDEVAAGGSGPTGTASAP